ncbi:MAG: RNA repair domain-containing protein [Desulfurococcales archaeon]
MTRKTILGILKEIRYSQVKNKYRIYIKDRMVSQGVKVISGEEIAGITQLDQILLVDGTIIPVHRVLRIEADGKVLIDRSTSPGRR